jgi:hypothetical protein
VDEANSSRYRRPALAVPAVRVVDGDLIDDRLPPPMLLSRGGLAGPCWRPGYTELASYGRWRGGGGRGPPRLRLSLLRLGS